MALTPKQRKAALERGFSVNLTSPDDAKYLSPNPKAASQLFAKTPKENIDPESRPSDGRPVVLPSDGRPVVLPSDPPNLLPSDPPSHYRQTGSGKKEKNKSILPSDRLTVVSETAETLSEKTIPLAPVQWAIWEVLCEADASSQLVSYRKLALRAKASIRGARDALAIIENEGGIVSKVTVRSSDEQGMRITIRRAHPFIKATLQETKGLLKRAGNYRQTVNRMSAALPSDGLRLSVCINNYIKQTDVAGLLTLFPPMWKLRERTLIEIARQFPEMKLIEFRQSIIHLVEQATKNRTDIKNHNAWVKAAFVKNEGPIITESMIEVFLNHPNTDQKLVPLPLPPKKPIEDAHAQMEVSILQKYRSASEKEKKLIDTQALEAAAAALKITPPERHNQIIEQAIIEATQEFFSYRLPKC